MLKGLSVKSFVKWLFSVKEVGDNAGLVWVWSLPNVIAVNFGSFYIEGGQELLIS